MLTTQSQTQSDIAALRRSPKRTTINDLAEALGMSKGTVSRALNDYPDISESTRRRVKRAAARAGYTPLSHAQAIRTGRVRALALVIRVDEHDGHSPFLTDFLAGVTQSASAVGWTLTIATANSEPDMLDVIERLVAERKADGFILPRTEVEDPRIRRLAALGVPRILYGRTGYGKRAAKNNESWFDICGETAMKTGVERLAGLGHTRIGFVGGAQNYNYSHLRLEGYKNGLRASGLGVKNQLIVTGTRTAEDGARAMLHLMQRRVPPTGIVFATDVVALGAYEAAEALGLKIGEDVSFLSYDGIPQGALMRPGLTTFKVDSYAAGERLASLLIRQIRGEPPHELREIAFANLVERQSDGPPAKSPEELGDYLSENSKNLGRDQ